MTKTLSTNDEIGQIETIRSLFYRQLLLPLAGLPDLLDEYRIFEEEMGFDKGDSKCSDLLNKANDLYRVGHAGWVARKALEAQVMTVDDARDDLNALKAIDAGWDAYIKFELTTEDPERLNIIYMRACEDLGHIRPDLWTSWIDYVHVHFNSRRALPLYNRALKYQPNNTGLWALYMLCQQEHSPSVSRIRYIFESALLSRSYTDYYVTDLNELIATCTECVKKIIPKFREEGHDECAAGARRPSLPNTSYVSSPLTSSHETVDWSPLRSIYQLVEDYLLTISNGDSFLIFGATRRHLQLTRDTQIPPPIRDALYLMLLHWAKAEASVCKDLEWLEKVGEKLVDNFGGRSSVWAAYVAFLRLLCADVGGSNILRVSSSSYTDVNDMIRDIYKRARENVTDFPQQIDSDLLSFEREMGTPESYRHALHLISGHEVSKEQQEFLELSQLKGCQILPEGSNDPAVAMIKQTVTQLRHRREKRRRKASETSIDVDCISDTSSDSGHSTHHTHYGKRQRQFSVGDVCRSRSPSPPNFAPNARSRSPSIPTSLEIEKVSESTWTGGESTSPSLAPAVPPVRSCRSPVRGSIPSYHSNVPPILWGQSAMPPPPFTPVKLPVSQASHSPPTITPTPMHDSPPPTGTDTPPVPMTDGDIQRPRMGKHFHQLRSSNNEIEFEESSTLWVSNLDITVSNKMLEEIFGALNGFKEVRLVKDFRGTSKGFAYIEFQTPADASCALSHTKGHKINQRPIKVAISQPTQPVYEKLTVFVTNIPDECGEDDIRCLFERVGYKTVDIRLPANESGKHRGRAYVDFSDEEQVKAIIAMKNPLEILPGKHVVVCYARK
eukprot:GHVO01015953.1.p1 GENE.GHVO01015953.1~~GHVO01015953.1.p1  ORF type:complete len:930 (-),score=199.82 GHVO01015953.1:580-3096(-)